jgi:hypothetical protein
MLARTSQFDYIDRIGMLTPDVTGQSSAPTRALQAPGRGRDED